MRVDRDQLLARIDLTDLLDELAGPPSRLGHSARWHCIHPGHDDLHPSVTVFVDRQGIQRWKCWSGGHGGTAIDALIAAKGSTVQEAIDDLTNRTGPAPTIPPQPRMARPPDVPLHPCVARYADACANILWTRTGHAVLNWLHTRGFPDDLLHVNRIGCDPGPALLRRPRGLPHGGIAAVFPALDPNGELTYAQARYLEPIEGRKYDNPAHTLGTNPRLAWPIPPRGTTTPRTLIVCEGIPDALTAAAAGFQSVAILGTATIDQQAGSRILEQANATGCSLTVVAFDADQPGDHAAQQLANHIGTAIATVRLRPPMPHDDLNAWALADPGWARDLAAGLDHGRTAPTIHPGPAPTIPAAPPLPST